MTSPTSAQGAQASAQREPALLRAPDTMRGVSYLELFFDLVYVFAVTRLSHLLLAHLNWAGAAETLVLFMAVWWAWNFMVWFTNWFDPDRLPIRLAVVAVMLAGLVMSAALPQAFAGRAVVFVLAYLGIQIGRHVFATLSLRGHFLSRDYLRALIWFGVSAVPWLAGALVTGAALRGGLWALAVAIEYGAAALLFPIPGLGRSTLASWTISGEHFVERCRLFVIIALGESVLIIGTAFGDANFTAARTTAFLLSFAQAVTLWWIYFALGTAPLNDAVRSAETDSRTGSLGLWATYVHLPLVAGVIVTAVGDELVIARPDGGHGADVTTALVLAAGPALFLAGHALMRRMITGTVNLPRILGIAALALLVPLSLVLPALVDTGLATAVLIAVAAADGRA